MTPPPPFSTGLPQIGLAARRRQAAERAASLQRLIAQGVPLKVAAYRAGISSSTALRYRKQLGLPLRKPRGPQARAA